MNQPAHDPRDVHTHTMYCTQATVKRSMHYDIFYLGIVLCIFPQGAKKTSMTR